MRFVLFYCLAIAALAGLTERGVSDEVPVVDVIIVAGQSNAVGAGRPSDLPESMQSLVVPRDDIRYCYWLNGTTWNSEWIDLAPRGGYSFGVEMMLGRVLDRAAPDRNLAIMKVAYNGTSLACAWNPHRELGGEQGPCNSSLYLCTQLKDWMTQWRVKIESEGMSCRFAGLVWVQGESDMLSNWMHPMYQSLLGEFIHEIRLHADNSDLPAVIALVNPRASHYGNQEPVQSAMLAVARDDPRIATVTCEDLPLKPDDVHFTAESMIWLGGRIGDALLTLNLFQSPDPVCPGDFDGDSDVDVQDFLLFLRAFGIPCP